MSTRFEAEKLLENCRDAVEDLLNANMEMEEEIEEIYKDNLELKAKVRKLEREIADLVDDDYLASERVPSSQAGALLRWQEWWSGTMRPYVLRLENILLRLRSFAENAESEWGQPPTVPEFPIVGPAECQEEEP